MTQLPDGLIALLGEKAVCYLATTMPDGSPQLTQTWGDTDGSHILINTVSTHQKARNVRRDPRVAVTVFDAARPSGYFAVRGRVIKASTEGAVDHIEALAQRYLGGSYPWWGGRDQTRLVLTIEADRVHRQGL